MPVIISDLSVRSLNASFHAPLRKLNITLSFDQVIPYAGECVNIKMACSPWIKLQVSF